jgi:formylmethanofuran dehydrogenase subunit D
MELGKFLTAPEYRFMIVTHRDIFQSAALENSRFGEEYRKLSAVVRMGPEDIQKLGVSKGDTVVVKNACGKVVVRVEESGYDVPHNGVAYMPNGPWSNTLVSADTGGTGVPKYKLIEVMISDAKGESITVMK